MLRLGRKELVRNRKENMVFCGSAGHRQTLAVPDRCSGGSCQTRESVKEIKCLRRGNGKMVVKDAIGP